MAQTSINVLKGATIDTSVEEAKQLVRDEREEKFKWYKSRWDTLNYAVIKHFRPDNIMELIGSSGSGKSFFLNMLKTDFTDYEPMIIPKSKYSSKLIERMLRYSEFVEVGENLVRPPINAEVSKKCLFAHFSLEMRGRDEILRTVSSIAGYDYSYLISSKGQRSDDGKFTYKKLEQEEMKFVFDVQDQYKRTRLPYLAIYEQFPTIPQLIITCRSVANYAHKNNLELIIGIDHSLLIRKSTEKDDQELHDEFAKALIEIKKDTRALVIPLIQMNSNIEGDNRKVNPTLHYPTKKDIYRGGQLFQAADHIFMMFNPASIHLEAYGPLGIPTNNLVHMSKIKGRFAGSGQVWLHTDFEHGSIRTIKMELNKKGKFKSGYIEPTLIKEHHPEFNTTFP
jgi:replicative DNA helicase